MVNPVKALRDVRVENILRFLLDTCEDGFDGVLTTSSGSKAVTVGLELGLPFGFQGELDQRLPSAIGEGGNAQRPLFVATRLGNPDATDRLRAGIEIQTTGKFQPLRRFEAGDAIDAGSILASIVLRHAEH